MFAHQMILLVQLTSNMMIRIHLNFHLNVPCSRRLDCIKLRIFALLIFWMINLIDEFLLL